MEKQQSTDTQERIVSTLRRRAQALRHQAIWTEQAEASGPGKLHWRDSMNEILALREESVVLERLADQYERKCRRG